MKFTPILGQDLSGSVGGITASRNASGNYLRARHVPTDPATAKQRQSREALTNIGPDFAALSSVEQASWATYAAGITFTPPIGPTYKLTGQQMYVRSKIAVAYFNEVAGFIANTVPNTAPAGPGLPVFSTPPTILSITAFNQTLTVSYDPFDAWVSEDGAFMAVRIGAPQGSGATAFTGPFTGGFFEQGNSTTPPLGTVLFIEPFSISQGMRQWIEVRLYRVDGGLSLPIIVGFDTVLP